MFLFPLERLALDFIDPFGITPLRKFKKFLSYVYAHILSYQEPFAVM